jgi:cytochrome c peroxidase
MLRALDAYQKGDGEFHLFTSKYDAVLDGRATLTAQEARGLALFNDRKAGHCAACHPSAIRSNGGKPLFTTSQYFALGVPRNTSQSTADPNFFDLGLCGPRRTDLAALNDLCGLFRTPTLRNVALTAPYYHNAVFKTLAEVVAFYATRDTDPTRWYPVVGGVVQKFNDLPAIFQANVTQTPPFGRVAGQTPALNQQDIDDIVAFLDTLTDGWTP